MTRKRLNLSEEAKDLIVELWINKTMTVTELANAYGCHPRTINRVMEERGVAAVTSKAKGISDVARVKKLLKNTGMTMDQLEDMANIVTSVPSIQKHVHTAALFRPGAQIHEAAHAAA